jgi:hypothetical protein
MVTEMDGASERCIVDAILEARPDDGIVAEEGTDRAGTSGVRWVVDPLDGTTNYLYRHPGFGVSVAAEVDGTVVAGPCSTRCTTSSSPPPSAGAPGSTAGRCGAPDARRRGPRPRPGGHRVLLRPGAPRRPGRRAHRGHPPDPRHPAHGRGRRRPVLGRPRPGRRLLRAGPGPVGPRRRCPGGRPRPAPWWATSTAGPRPGASCWPPTPPSPTPSATCCAPLVRVPRDGDRRRPHEPCETGTIRREHACRR